MRDFACSWCGADTRNIDRFEVYERAGMRKALFCRLEHIVPWTIRGAHWEPAETLPELSEGGKCSFCDGELPNTRIDLLRHRAGFVVDDAFCGLEHLGSWARAGGRFAKP